ncbi:DUF4956 domain-containing protein [Cyclobacterium qasimii]|uniref:DUF4956 domain-containing protein n=2 Tax=Cyclobacterium qasimii TaxID=1350429 RepID=S7WF51_9BACT|nr:DUF4956 domain-containing protein [Cyclobacterium qasimii]EPR65389.1 hypothetical protein ADICYQ_5598 [Cyclobacterium qasimii M12-11B]GEO20106.1 hypothetical protein CQA01_06400 [Cyclobacterium qasimii]
MFELFPDQPVYEYPQLVNITYSFIWAFVLSSLIAITHKLTFTGDVYPKNFFQSLILGALVTSLVMMAIGDSLARGLGVFGAMAIIRFRTRIDDPRDVLFLFAALSTGLAIGVYGFTISFVGAILFCLVALLLHTSPFRSFKYHNQLYFTIDDTDKLATITSLFENHCQGFRMLTIQVNKEMATRYQYAITLNSNVLKDEFINHIKAVEGISQIKLSSNENLSN